MENNKCFLCEDKHFISTNSGADIDIVNGNRLIIDANEYSVKLINIEINYCPICGRKLESTIDKGYTIG